MENILVKSVRGDWIRLRTLIFLRWLAIFGQSLAVIYSYFVLKLQFQVGVCLFLVVLAAIINIAITVVYPKSKRLSERENFFILLSDLIQLSSILFFTGGLTNPFAMLILAPVTISATVLGLWSTIFLGSAAVFLISVLSLFYVPLIKFDGEILQPPYLLLIGNWIALMITMFFLAGYSRRVTMETLSMGQALQAMQMALAREQKLTALGGVVAATAHELGTPLATIKLASTELKNGFSTLQELNDDLDLISSQADRCRDILRDMGRRGKDDKYLHVAPLIALVEEAAEPHADRGKKIIYCLNGNIGHSIDDFQVLSQPNVYRRAELIHGLRNLIQNAVDFSSSTVWVNMSWDEKRIIFGIADDGLGFPSNLIDRIGDPFLTSRFRDNVNHIKKPEYEGMGLGFFIAKTLLEHLGASVEFYNGNKFANHHVFEKAVGANVNVIFSREMIQVADEKIMDSYGANPVNQV